LYCGAVLVPGIPYKFHFKPFGDRIRGSLPLPIEERLFNRTVQLREANSTFLRILNRDLRPVFQHACVSFPYDFHSRLFISGIPNAFNTFSSFTMPLYAAFCWSDWGFPIPAGDIGKIIVVLFSPNGPHQGYLRN
jgi:hypothetical protein